MRQIRKYASIQNMPQSVHSFASDHLLGHHSVYPLSDPLSYYHSSLPTSLLTPHVALTQDGRTLGDSWLEHKGRAMPPGPEKRRGRQNLNETLQQTSNPYEVRA